VIGCSCPSCSFYPPVITALLLVGASFGDLLTKPKSSGGLGLGTAWTSLVIFFLFMLFFGYELYVLYYKKKVNQNSEEGENKTKQAQDNYDVESVTMDA
jgi:hypothetical protein